VRRALALLIFLMAPMWLGPAMGPIAALLGGTLEHQCACGMRRGDCGCPTCMEAERERVRASRQMVVRTTCDTDGLAPIVAVAPQVVAFGAARVIPPHVIEAPMPLTPRALTGRTSDPPEIPPPRAA